MLNKQPTKSCLLIPHFNFGIKMNYASFYAYLNKKNIMIDNDIKKIKAVSDKIFSNDINSIVSIDKYPILPRVKDAYRVDLTDNSFIYIVIYHE